MNLMEFFVLGLLYGLDERMGMPKSYDVRKPSGFPTMSDTNQAVQPQNMARGLKFRIHEEHELYYICSENSRSASLFSHMQTAGFLMTGLKYYGMRWLDCYVN